MHFSDIPNCAINRSCEQTYVRSSIPEYFVSRLLSLDLKL
jgi:hypothetical protein